MNWQDFQWDDLQQARASLGLTEAQMAKLLGVAMSTFQGWGTRDKVPKYIASSVHFLVLMHHQAPKLYRGILAEHERYE